MRLRVWSPEKEESAPYLAEIQPHLWRHPEIEPAAGEAADLDLYPIGDGPAFALPYRAALRRPGVVLLQDWNLHALVRGETRERGGVRGYLREMRRSGGESGTFVARQIVRGLGGDLLPALFPLNDRLLEGSLAVVAATEHIRSRVARALPGRPVLHLPFPFLVPRPGGSPRELARRARGLAERDLLIGAAGEARSLARAEQVAERLRGDFPSLRLEVLSAPDRLFDLAAADVVLALHVPSGGGVPPELVRAALLGIPALVSAGTPAEEEFPEGAVVPVDPGPSEAAEIEALLRLLLVDPSLRQAIGRLAREHVESHSPQLLADRLAVFLAGVERGKEAALGALNKDRAAEGSRLEYLMEEVRWAARDLGLAGARLGLEPLLAPLGKDAS
ncbi:MAG TPA: hypothetical protein VN461_19285 [Vicinamibacteria bacterium]|nr:hypothetical protein [Vicinamibacteria bacterium]